jgi:GPI mannosyltransferase 3
VKEIIKSKYARLFLAGLGLFVICSWFSTGFHQADEHFQVLEFCNYKMGNSPAADMPWEFHQKARASLLPGIAYGIAEIMKGCGFYNPFTLAFLLRLLAAFASWYITCKLCLLLIPKFKKPETAKLFILMALFLWFIPYISVRFTSENISGLFFLYGIYLILDVDKNTILQTHKGGEGFAKYLGAGLLFGVSFFLRFQIVFAIAGLGAWLIFVRKINFKYIFALGISGALAIYVNILLDRWFYRGWTLSPFNYYYANIIQHRAADSGLSPWWFYFTEFTLKVVPPLSLLLLIMFFAGIFKNLKDPLVWAIIPFIMLHCFVGHKELRFLFPVAFASIYITALGFDWFLAKEWYRKTHKYVYAVSLLMCIPLLLYRTLVPANIAANYFKFLYNNVPQRNTVLFSLGKDNAYAMYDLNSSFYKTPDFKTIQVDSMEQLKNYLLANQPESAFYLSRNLPDSLLFKNNVPGYKAEAVYCLLPSWVLKYNVNNWEERTRIWSIYRFNKIE